MKGLAIRLPAGSRPSFFWWCRLHIEPSRSLRASAAPIFIAIIWVVAWVIGFLILTATCSPSYTRPPQHYHDLRRAVSSSGLAGRGNPYNETIFISISLYDPSGKVAGGRWGEQLIELISILGHRHVFVSIYESDSGQEGQEALEELQRKLPCRHAVVSEPAPPLSDDMGFITMPDGGLAVKRVPYLARVRNKALEPLDDMTFDMTFDKILFLNDVLYDPVDAVQLLFSTHLDAETHRARYAGACAVDFDTRWGIHKMYDWFAVRDFDGYGLGLPIYPWFSATGHDEDDRYISYGDVVTQRDAVRVRSCWGGMAAFDARFFQAGRLGSTAQGRGRDEQKPSVTLPLRFRADNDLYHEASECCLIHADLAAAAVESFPEDLTVEGRGRLSQELGIYLNPYVRTSYDSITSRHIGLFRRIERSLWFPKLLIDWFHGGYRSTEERRGMLPKEMVEKIEWNSTSGSWIKEERPVNHGSFCTRQGAMFIRLGHREEARSWEAIELPSGRLGYVD